jgi:hypothetical protein
MKHFIYFLFCLFFNMFIFYHVLFILFLTPYPFVKTM